MNIESNLSGHWTDEQLIEHLYGIGPEDEHLESCIYCRDRLSSLMAARRANESEAPAADQIPFDLLAAQRRTVYARIEREQHGNFALRMRRWAAAGAMVALLGGGTFLYQQRQRTQEAQSKVTDAQLAQEVSQMAQDSEPASTAPLQGLFDE
jgi:predicted anti-sigma-YlaC factor YlaD